MNLSLKKITRAGIGALIFALVLGLGLVQPAKADDKFDQNLDFVPDCNADGPVSVPAGTQMEVFNFDGLTGVITRDCTVTLAGEDSELNLAEFTDLAFCDSVDEDGVCVGPFYDFIILAAAPGFEIEIQVKKNSIIQANNFTVTIGLPPGAEEAEAQFEEDFCLVLHGNLSLTMNTGTDGGGDVQLKKFDDLSSDKLCDGGAGQFNIDVAGNITLSVGGGDSEIQIEESNHIRAGGNISVSGAGVKSQVQTKKNVTLDAGGNITLEATDPFSEVQAEDSNTFIANGSITLEVGANGKLEVKKDYFFNADADNAGGGAISILHDAGTSCKVEDPGTLGADCP